MIILFKIIDNIIDIIMYDLFPIYINNLVENIIKNTLY